MFLTTLAWTGLPDEEPKIPNPEAAPAPANWAPLHPHTHPAALTPVGDYVDTSTQAVPEAVLVLFLAELPVAHPDPVAVLEELPGGLLPPPGAGQRLSFDPTVGAAVR